MIRRSSYMNSGMREIILFFFKDRDKDKNTPLKIKCLDKKMKNLNLILVHFGFFKF